MALPGVSFSEQDQGIPQLGQSALGTVLCVGYSTGSSTLAVADQVLGYGTIPALQAGQGAGEVVEAAALVLRAASENENGGGVVYVASVYSYNGTQPTLVVTGSGTHAPTVTGNPTGPFEIAVLIVAGGSTGACTFKVSLNGGQTYGPVQTSPSGGTAYLVPGTGPDGVTITIPNQTMVTADVWAGSYVQDVGTAGAVTQVGSGPAVTVDAACAPIDDYDVVLQVVVGGAVATATMAVSYDGGNTFSNPVATASTLTLSNGIIVDLAAGTYVKGTLYSFSCTAPSFSLTDLANLFELISGSNQPPFEAIWVVGRPGSDIDPTASTAAAAFAALISALDTAWGATSAAFTTGIQPTLPICGAPIDTTQNNIDAALATQTASISTDFVSACAGDINVQSPISLTEIQRSCDWAAAPRIAQVRYGHHLGEVADGPLLSVTAILRDETNTPALDNDRITSCRTLPGLPGFWITRGRIMSSPLSDFDQVQYRRVVNAAIRAARPVLLGFLNGEFPVLPSGTIDPIAANMINKQVGKAIGISIVQPGDVQAAFYQVDQTVNLELTDTIKGEIGIQPNGYAEFISTTVAFLNPLLS
jgi:hypothetical protein